MLKIGQKYTLLYHDIARHIEAVVRVSASDEKRFEADTLEIISDTRNDLKINGLKWALENSEITFDHSDFSKVQVHP